MFLSFLWNGSDSWVSILSLLPSSQVAREICLENMPPFALPTRTMWVPSTSSLVSCISLHPFSFASAVSLGLVSRSHNPPAHTPWPSLQPLPLQQSLFPLVTASPHLILWPGAFPLPSGHPQGLFLPAPWHLPGLCASHCPALPLGTPSLSWCEHLALRWWSPDHNSASHLSQKFNPRILEWDVGGLCPGDVHTHLRCSRKVPGFPVFALQASSPVSLALRVIPAPPPTHLALWPHHFSKSYGFYIISNSNILFPLSYYYYLIPTLAIFHLDLRSGCLTLGAVLTWLTCFTKCLRWWPIRCVTWETKLM